MTDADKTPFFDFQATEKSGSPRTPEKLPQRVGFLPVPVLGFEKLAKNHRRRGGHLPSGGSLAGLMLVIQSWLNPNSPMQSPLIFQDCKSCPRPA
jgi:hypothetical protein